MPAGSSRHGAARDVLDRPLHPYTHGLIGSVPSRNRRGEPLRQIPGMTPSLLDLPRGLRLPHRAAPRADARLRARAARRRAGRRPRTLRCFHPLERGAGMSARRSSSCAGVSQALRRRLDAAARADAVPSRRRARRRATKSCMPSTTSTCRSAAARSSAWSANPAAASPRSGAWSPASCRRRTGSVLCKGTDIARRCRREQRARRAAQGADDLPGPLRLAQPAPARGRHRRRGAAWCTAWSTARRVRRLRRRAAAPRRPRSRVQAPLSAPVLRRPAPAHRHRPRAGRAAGVPGLRRGGGRARRVDPGADPQPVHGAARASST